MLSFGGIIEDKLDENLGTYYNFSNKCNCRKERKQDKMIKYFCVSKKYDFLTLISY